jgi:hypothetical protein
MLRARPVVCGSIAAVFLAGAMECRCDPEREINGSSLSNAGGGKKLKEKESLPPQPKRRSNSYW